MNNIFQVVITIYSLCVANEIEIKNERPLRTPRNMKPPRIGTRGLTSNICEYLRSRSDQLTEQRQRYTRNTKCACVHTQIKQIKLQSYAVAVLLQLARRRNRWNSHTHSARAPFAERGMIVILMMNASGIILAEACSF